MSPNRKAEIQRKLSLKAVPTPPDGLADRIKNDIPKYLEAERDRFSRSIALNMRVAASILLLVTSVFVTINLLEPEEEAAKKSAPSVAAAPRRSTELRDVATASTAAVEELRTQLAQAEQPVMQIAQTSTLAPAPEATRVRRDEGQRATAVEAGVEGSVEGGVAGGLVGGTVAAPTLIAEAAPPPPIAVAAPAAPEVMSNVTHPAPVAEPQPQRADAKQTSRIAASSGFVREAIAADLALGPKGSVFGISVDPTAFERIKTTIEQGSRPAASSINVEALVNYFAGAPKRVRRDVQIEGEGSPAPVGTNGRRGFVRFTVDTRSADLGPNGSATPVATDARIEIDFNSRAVASFQRIGNTAAIAPEATLLGNTSVTGMYEVQLKPAVGPRTRIATIRLRYRSVADGKEKSRYVVVYGSDFARKWSKASPRHRLASLGAVWGESLKGSGGASDVAVKAEELATQSPNDAKAKELAAAANALAGTER